MKKFLSIVSILLLTISLNAQENFKQEMSPNGIFDQVFDRFGNKYSLEDLKIDTGLDSNNVQKSALLCSSGYFDIYFEAGSGMEGSSSVEVARRNVVCQVFSDISDFINSPLSNVGNTNRVNIEVRDIGQFISSPSTSGVLGAATSYYNVPNNTTSGFGGIADNEIWKTIHSGVDSYTNVTAPISSTGTSFYHGMMYFNFSNSGISWNTNLSLASSPTGLVDLYSVILHEVTHALGFASLIDENGLSKFGTGYNYYSRYDLFLKDHTSTDNLITNTGSCSLYEYQYNPLLSLTEINPGGCSGSGSLDNTVCNDAAIYSGSTVVPLYTPNCFEPPSSLSHFEDECYPTSGLPYGNNLYFNMSNALGTGAVYTKRYLKPEERLVLCDLGYSTNATFGSVTNNNFFNYSTSTCSEINVAGINDGISSTGSFQFAGTVSNNITISGILSNDYNATSFECLEDVFDPSASLSVTSGTSSITFSSSVQGVHLLRYIPVYSGQRGNITYIYVYVGVDACSPSACNMISNGDFETLTTSGDFPSGPSQIVKSCGWNNANNATSDFYHSSATNLNFSVPCSSNGFEPDNKNLNAYAGFAFAGKQGYNECIYSELSTPLLPNTTYKLTFDVSLQEAYSGNDFPLQVYFEQNYTPTTGLTVPTPNTNMLFTVSPVNDYNGWTNRTITFTTGTTAGENFMVIGALKSSATPNVLTPAPLNEGGCSLYNITPFGIDPINKISFSFIDNLVLLPENEYNGTLSLPTSICHILPDLNLYATPPGGVFSGTGVTLNAGIYSFDPAIAGVGNHSITYTYTSSLGCVYDITTIIEVVNSTINLSISPLSQTICLGQSTTLTASGASTYIWSPATGLSSTTGTNVTANPTTTTTYTVTGTDVNGCSATSSVPVTVDPNCGSIDCSLSTTKVIPNGAISSTISIPSGSVVEVQGLFTINSTATYTNVKFKMAAGARIDILSGNTLTLRKCHLFSCTQLWKEITVNPNANLVVQNYTIIEDAEQAIHWIDGGAVIINSSIFNRNGAGVHLETNFSNTVATNVVVTNTIFTCRDFPASFYQTSFSAGSFASLKTDLLNNNLILYPYSSLIAPANTRSLYGVKTKGLEATIGSSGLLKNRNLFDYLDFGIHASQNANLTAVNNAFANLSGYGIKSTIIGVGIFAEKKGTFINIGGNNTKDGNSFKNCYRGANITDYNTINFINNSITNTSTSPTFSPPTYNIGHYGLAIFSTVMQYSNIHLNYNIHKNNISNNAIGVYINSIYSSIVSQNIQLTQNNLDVTGSGTYCNQGIWMQSLSGSTANVGDVFVSGNTVKGSNMQALLFENVNNMLRVDLNPELSVLNNTSPSKQAIRLNSCNGAMVTNNTVATTNNTSIPSGNLGGFITGIYLNNSPSCIVTCNTANYLDVCVLFDQPNSMAYLANNSMNKAQYGLVLANGAIIGQQGSATQPSGNTWGANNPTNITLKHTYTYLTPNANSNSPLYCKPNTNPNCAIGGFKTLPCSNSSFPFLQEYQLGTGINTATGSSPPCAVLMGNPLANAKALLHEADSGNGNAVIKFMHKRQAFHLIKTDTTGSLLADNELNTFYNQEQTQSIGKISTTNEMIGNNNLIVAQSTNNSIIPINVAEHNIKEVNTIWLQSLLDTAYVFTTSDSTTLYTIGSICMQQGGEATVLARALLANFTQSAMSFNDCMELPFDNGQNNKTANNKMVGGNLILNGSFEIINWDTTGYAMLAPWEFPQFGSPDWFFPTGFPASFSSDDTNAVGYQLPQHGLNYMGGLFFASGGGIPTNYGREPVIAKTSITLSSGAQYCLSYYISMADIYNCVTNRSDAYFSSTPMDPTLNSPPYLMYVQPHIMADSTIFYTGKENWAKIEGSYTALGGENYITIGNLHLDGQTDTLCNGIIDISPNEKSAYYYLDNFSLEEIKPVEAGLDVTITNGDTIVIGNNADSASSYIWSPNYFIDDVNALNPTVNPPVTTTYYVTKTQCSVTTIDSVTVVVGGVGLSEVSNENNVRIYPNPTTGETTLLMDGESSEWLIVVSDIQGRKIHEKTYSTNKINLKLVADNGVYFVYIANNTTNETITKKLIINK